MCLLTKTKTVVFCCFKLLLISQIFLFWDLWLITFACYQTIQAFVISDSSTVICHGPIIQQKQICHWSKIGHHSKYHLCKYFQTPLSSSIITSSLFHHWYVGVIECWVKQIIILARWDQISNNLLHLLLTHSTPITRPKVYRYGKVITKAFKVITTLKALNVYQNIPDLHKTKFTSKFSRI